MVWELHVFTLRNAVEIYSPHHAIPINQKGFHLLVLLKY